MSCASIKLVVMGARLVHNATAVEVLVTATTSQTTSAVDTAAVASCELLLLWLLGLWLLYVPLYAGGCFVELYKRTAAGTQLAASCS